MWFRIISFYTIQLIRFRITFHFMWFRIKCSRKEPLHFDVYTIQFIRFRITFSAELSLYHCDTMKVTYKKWQWPNKLFGDVLYEFISRIGIKNSIGKNIQVRKKWTPAFAQVCGNMYNYERKNSSHHPKKRIIRFDPYGIFNPFMFAYERG